jgi:hypothetical protein
MRIRSALTGLVLGAGVLLLGAPAALAQPSSAPTTSTTAPAPLPRVTEAPPTAPTKMRQSPLPTVRPAPVGVAVKPKGAAETGGGGTKNDSSQALFVLGGAALVATGGVGTLAYRRFRRES